MQVRISNLYNVTCAFKLLWMYYQLDCALYKFLFIKQKILSDLYNSNTFYKLFKCYYWLTDILMFLPDISKLITFTWLNEFLSYYCSVIAWVKSYILVCIVSNIAKENIDAPVCASDHTTLLPLEKSEKDAQGGKKILRFVRSFCFSMISCNFANMRERATFLRSTCFNPLLHNFLFQCGIHLRTRDTTNICIKFIQNRKYLFPVTLQLCNCVS